MGLALATLCLTGYAQQVPARPDSIPVKNWPVRRQANHTAGDQGAAAAGSTSGLVFISITPCRVMDTRAAGGSGKTGQFGPPSLVANQARVISVPSSNCGVPIAAAYSMNPSRSLRRGNRWATYRHGRTMSRGPAQWF